MTQLKRFLYYESITCVLSYGLAAVLMAAYVLNIHPTDGTDYLLSEALNPLAIEKEAWGLSLVVMHILFWVTYFTTFEERTEA